MPFLPRSLTWYIASSAAWISPSADVGHVGQRRDADRHGQMDVRARRPAGTRCAAIRSRMRSPTAERAFAGRCRAGSPRTRRRRTARRCRSRGRSRGSPPPASTSARLPSRWPCVSLIALKPSRSMNSSDSGRPLRDARLVSRRSTCDQVARVVELRQVVGDRQRLGALHAQRVIERDGCRLQRSSAAPRASPARIAVPARRHPIEPDQRADRAAPARQRKPDGGARHARLRVGSRRSVVRSARQKTAPVRITQRADHRRRRLGCGRQRRPCRAPGPARRRRPRARASRHRAASRRPATTSASATRSGSRLALTARIIVGEHVSARQPAPQDRLERPQHGSARSDDSRTSAYGAGDDRREAATGPASIGRCVLVE